MTLKSKIGQCLSFLFVVLFCAATMFVPPAKADFIYRYQPTQIIDNPSPAGSDWFGNTVDMDGDNILIGAYLKDAGAGDSGEAYLFKAGTEYPATTFRNPDPQVADYFGGSAAIDGDKVVIGAPWKAVSGVGGNAGIVYLFDRATGDLLQTITTPESTGDDTFGYSVAIDGDQILIGARYADYQGKADAGKAFLFDTNGQYLQTFYNPDPQGDDRFGYAVDLDGDKVLIGAPWKYVSGVGGNAGLAYLFDANTGDLLQTFATPESTVDDTLGYAVAIDGDNVLVGAPYADLNGADAGKAFLFSATTGEALQTFTNFYPKGGDYFGGAVDLSGNSALIGAGYRDIYGINDAGQAYLFDTETGDLLESYSTPDPKVGDNFGGNRIDHLGSPVAIDGNAVVIGGYTRDLNGKGDAGQGFTFNIGNEAINPPAVVVPNVEIDATLNNKDNPVVQPFTAGTYTIQVLSKGEGGTYDAWKSGSVGSCDSTGENCSRGWETRYYVRGNNSYKKVVDESCTTPTEKAGSCAYNTAELAAANPPEDYSFTIKEDTDVQFYMWDSGDLTDNEGGLSLLVTKQ